MNRKLIFSFISIFLLMFSINVYASDFPSVTREDRYIGAYDSYGNPLPSYSQCGSKVRITCPEGEWAMCTIDRVYYKESSYISVNSSVYRPYLKGSQETTVCKNVSKVNSNRYVKEGSRLECGEKVYVTTCYDTSDGKICNYVNKETKDYGTIEASFLEKNRKSAEATCANSGFEAVNEIRYIKSGSGAGMSLPCGSALYITKCDYDGRCYFNSYTDENGATKNLNYEVYVDSNGLTDNQSNTKCPSPQEEEKNKLNKDTCSNSRQLNVRGTYTFNVCYDSSFDSNEIKDLVASLVSCGHNHKLDETAIRAEGNFVKGDGVNSRDYTVECVEDLPAPTLSAESGFAQSNGYGEIKLKATTYGSKIVAYYVSETKKTPSVSSSGWKRISENTFTYKSTAGTLYFWVKDNQGKISSVVSASVIDRSNDKNTVKTLELKDSGGNKLSLKKNNNVAYYYNNSMNVNYALLSNNRLLADGFDPFATEYEIEVDSPTVTVAATLTSGDASYVEGYGPRTVTLDYGVNTILIKIKDNSGKIRTYTIIATRKDNRSSDNVLKSLSVSSGNISFNANVTDYNIKIPKGTDSVNVKAEKSSELSSFVDGFGPGEVKITGNTTTKLIKVRSQTGSTRTYILTFIKEGAETINKESLQLFEFSIPQVYVPFESTISNYSLYVDYSMDSIDIYPTLKNKDSKMEIFIKNKEDDYEQTTTNGIPLDVGANYLDIKITDSSGEVAYYRFTIIRKEFGLAVEDSAFLKDLRVLNYDIDFDKNIREYNVKIKSEKSLVITAVPESNRAEVFILGNDELNAFSTIRVKVVAENGEDMIYSIDIEKDPFNKELEKFAVIAGGVIILISLCIIILKKQMKFRKDYYRE